MVTCSNHCNGLVCVYNYKDTQVYLYNVTTGEIKALSLSLSCPDGSIQFPYTPKLFLGFDPVTEKYKLLHVSIWYNRRPKIKILTLGINSWREIREIPEEWYSSRSCIFVNGVLYWTDACRHIDYFNFREEKFGILSLSLGMYYHFNELSKMQTALWGKLVSSWYYSFKNGEEGYSVYDEVTKDFMDFNFIPKLEKERLDKTELVEILATTSLICAPTSLAFPNCLLLSHASSFVENIMPLDFIEDF